MALFPSGGAAVKGRVLASFPSTVEGTGGISVSKSNGIWTIEPAWDDLSVETTLADASARQLWIYNPSTDVYTRLSVQYLLDNLPEGPAGDTGATGATGAQGASVGVQFTYSTTTTDSDPGSGVFRFNNATIASVTAAYIDNNDAGGSSVTTWLDTFDDSTTTHKGYLVIRGVTTQSAWAVFSVTGSVTDGTGYRKLTLTHVASGGTWTNTETFAFNFSRTGDKGSDGAGTGDVTAAAANTADNRVVRTDGSSGKGIQESVINLDDTTGTLYPQTNDSGALGKAAQSWADLFLASGGVINWNNGTFTATQSGTTLAFSGALTATSYNGLTVTTSTGTLTITNGKTLSISNTLTLAGTDSTTMTFPSTSSTVITTGNTATITKGYSVTPYSQSWASNFTVDPSQGNYQYATNDAARTITAPASDCAVDILITNHASTAGSITFSGFTVGSSTGSTYATTGNNKYLLSIRRINSVATYSWYALQ